MEPTFNEWQRQPRPLLYRAHYKWYAIALAVGWGACLVAAITLGLLGGHQDELIGFSSFALLLPMLYLVWLHPKLTSSMQVFTDGIRIASRGEVYDVKFNDLVSVSWSLGIVLRLKHKDGHTWTFTAALERLDYLWEALWRSRPELVGSSQAYEEKRLRIVQNDHHEKRKEWFFRHRLVDVMNWIVLPMIVLIAGYKVQTAEVVIHSPGLYFFRLGMFVLLVTICSSFFYALIAKRLVFDRILAENMGSDRSKRRDVAHENVVVQRIKSLQLVTCSVIMFSVLYAELNLYSVTRLREGVQAFYLKPGKTVVVDNRYNCIACKHSIKEGDIILFGKGSIGKVLALPGDVIAQTSVNDLGRTIASESVQTVPEGHVALHVGVDGREVAYVRIDDLVGKLKNQ